MIRFLRKFWGEEPHGLQAEHEREVFINLDLAYVCSACRFIQQRAPQGTCRRCGAKEVVNVDLALSSRMERLYAHIADAKARRTQQSRAQPTQAPQSLTEFRVKE